MPQKNNNSEPPPVMTWGKAVWVLAAAVVFDLLRIMFEQFWFFGPALATAYCTIKVGGTVGTTVAGWLCGPAALAAGIVGFAAIETFGIVMAMATGLFGWLVVLVLLMLFNRRIFKENAGNMVLFGASLLVSEVPLLGTIPAISIIVWRMYSTQIRKDKAALVQYEKERAAARLQEQQLLVLERIRLETIQQSQEAANYEASSNVIRFPSGEPRGVVPEKPSIPEETKRAA